LACGCLPKGTTRVFLEYAPGPPRSTLLCVIMTSRGVVLAKVYDGRAFAALALLAMSVLCWMMYVWGTRGGCTP
jgi:hypothetical protein